MKNHRISTTISEKHWVLLHKFSEKYQSQQKTLEVALENLENSSKQIPELTQEEKLWMRLKKEKFVCVLEKNAFRILLENANIEPLQEYFIQHRIMELSIELFFQRAMKDLTLKEVIDGIVSTGKLVNWLDTVDYMEDENNYTLVMTHSFCPNVSELLVTAIEHMFKTCGVKVEITDSSSTIFIKIFKS